MSLLRSSLVLCSLALLGGPLACSSTPQPDASPDTGTDSGTPLACDARAPDAGDPAPIYGFCRINEDCAAGLICKTEAGDGWPGGYCTRACDNDDQCYSQPPPRDGFCYENPRSHERLCLPTCLNGEDCGRDGFTCFSFTTDFGPRQACLPVCTDTSCTNGTHCDHESNRCVPNADNRCYPQPADAGTPVGARIGQQCNPMAAAGEAMHCLSNNCLGESNPDSGGNPVYSGWNGGYCISRCILPPGYNSSTFWQDGRTMPLPQANCPDHGLCLPQEELAAGDLGLCLAECTTNADCRANQGYYCRRSVQLQRSTGVVTFTFPNGWCTPINCANSATPCPMGLRCQINPSTRVGSCIPST